MLTDAYGGASFRSRTPALNPILLGEWRESVVCCDWWRGKLGKYIHPERSVVLRYSIEPSSVNLQAGVRSFVWSAALRASPTRSKTRRFSPWGFCPFSQNTRLKHRAPFRNKQSPMLKHTHPEVACAPDFTVWAESRGHE